MALYRVRVIGRYTGSGVAEDDMSMSWGVDSATVPDPIALQAAWVAVRAIPAASTSWAALLSNAWGTHAWEVRAAAGGPVLAYEEVARVQGGQNPGPSTLTFPVQWVVPAGQRTALRGRLNIGPVGTGGLGVRPSSAYIGYALTFCENWHAQLVGLGHTPVFLKNGGLASDPIIGYSMGNSWGTMRSRKSAITARTTRIL